MPFKPCQVLPHWLRTPGTQVLAHTLMVGDTPCLNHTCGPANVLHIHKELLGEMHSGQHVLLGDKGCCSSFLAH